MAKQTSTDEKTVLIVEDANHEVAILLSTPKKPAWLNDDQLVNSVPEEVFQGLSEEQKNAVLSALTFFVRSGLHPKFAVFTFYGRDLVWKTGSPLRRLIADEAEKCLEFADGDPRLRERVTIIGIFHPEEKGG